MNSNLAEKLPDPALPAIGESYDGGFFAGQIAIDGKHYALVVAPKAEGQKPT